MGNWKCPKCGPCEILPVEDQEAGEVVKCKPCGRILNADLNYAYTPEEVAQIKDTADSPRWYDSTFVGLSMCVFFSILLLIVGRMFMDSIIWIIENGTFVKNPDYPPRTQWWAVPVAGGFFVWAMGLGVWHFWPWKKK